jgi:hypothetical protein
MAVAEKQIEPIQIEPRNRPRKKKEPVAIMPPDAGEAIDR